MNNRNLIPVPALYALGGVMAGLFFPLEGTWLELVARCMPHTLDSFFQA